jgi:hypothetical protein
VAKTPEDAAAYVQTLVGTLPGIRRAPQYPPDKSSVFPFAVAWPDVGKMTREDASTNKNVFNIILAIHTARKNLARDMETIEPFIQQIGDLLLDTDNITLSGTVDTVIAVDWKLEPNMAYGDVDTIGYVFTIEAKIRS